MIRLIFILAVFLCSFSNRGISQVEKTNLEIIQTKKLANEHKYQSRKVSYLFKEKSFLVKYNPVSLAFGGLLAFYQKVISQQLASHCPYEISCSEFSKLCISEYGLIKGTALTADRLTRCTEFTQVDMHPLWMNEHNQIIDPIHKYQHHKKHKH